MLSFVPVDGSWASWESWSSCSRTCGDGKSVRFRFCVDPRPEFGGNQCEGKFQETLDCNEASCPGKSIIVIRILASNF